ncbi:MAG: LysR family transcriptional regulator [Rhodobacteraceae bacterium]|nr:LysR family transcriptional regulator [Paracoccaceae bacterium]
MPNRPTLRSLVSFEATARLNSFTRAADELSMTQSAVSHQVKSLEDLLGQPLFNRLHRGAVTTDAGNDLIQTVRDCLDLLDHGLRRLEQYKKPNQIIVSSPRSFAEAVLLPKLAQYKGLHPEHNIWLHTEDTPIDPLLGEVFVTIWPADRRPEGIEATPICDEFLTPLATPALIERHGVRSPADLFAAILLHDERREDWPTWFAAAGVNGGHRVDGYNFSDSGLLLQAATRDLGIALGSLTLARGLLDSGALVAPFPDIRIAAPGYLMISSPEALKLERVRTFRAWLLDRLSEEGRST